MVQAARTGRKMGGAETASERSREIASRFGAVFRLALARAWHWATPKDAEATKAVMLAAHAGDVEAIRDDLARANVKERNVMGLTPLMNAAWQGHAECVRELLPFSRVNDAEGWKRNRVAYAELPHPGKTPRAGDTALIFAARHGGLPTLRLLIAASNAKKTNLLGETALMAAAETGSMGCVAALLPKGSLAARDARGHDALSHAAMSRRESVVALLLQNGAKASGGKRSSPLWEALNAAPRGPWREGELENGIAAAWRIWSALSEQEKEAQANWVGKGGATPLMLAAATGDPEWLRSLLGAKANPQARDAEGLTALSRTRVFDDCCVECARILAPFSDAKERMALAERWACDSGQAAMAAVEAMSPAMGQQERAAVVRRWGAALLPATHAAWEAQEIMDSALSAKSAGMASAAGAAAAPAAPAVRAETMEPASVAARGAKIAGQQPGRRGRRL